MIKSELVDGTPILIVKIEHFVKHTDFSRALADYFFMSDVPESIGTLTKKRAFEILKHALFFNGLSGEYEDGYFEASYEQGEEYNIWYERCSTWVTKNYPFLIKKGGSDASNG